MDIISHWPNLSELNELKGTLESFAFSVNFIDSFSESDAEFVVVIAHGSQDNPPIVSSCELLGSLALAMLKVYKTKLYRMGCKKCASIVLGRFILCTAKGQR